MELINILCGLIVIFVFIVSLMNAHHKIYHGHDTACIHDKKDKD